MHCSSKTADVPVKVVQTCQHILEYANTDGQSDNRMNIMPQTPK